MAENGQTSTFTVVLDAPPTADVTIGVSSTDTSKATVDVSSLTFTSSDWASPLPATRTAACRTTHHHPHPAHAPLTSHVQAPFWQVVPLLQHVHAVHLENGPFLLVQQHVSQLWEELWR